MVKLNRLFFIINGFLLGLFSFASTTLINLEKLFFIYLIFTSFHLILLSITTKIDKKRLHLILILFFFTFVAVLNTLIRDHFEAVSGWPSLVCFSFFSFYYIFREQFDLNSDNIILVLIIMLFSMIIYLFVNIDYQFFGLNQFGQSILEENLRHDLRTGNSDKEIFFNKNYIAKYFFWSLFILFLYRLQKDKVDNLNIYILILAILSTLLLSSAKLIIISFINLVTYLFINNSFYKKIYYIIFLLVFFTCFFLMNNFFNPVYEIFNSKIENFLSGTGSRAELILDGLKLTYDSLFGSGLYYSREQLGTYSHNSFVETIIALGPFLSLIFFLYLFLKFRVFYGVNYLKLIINTLIFLSFFQSIYFDYFILPMVLCFISIYQKKNNEK